MAAPRRPYCPAPPRRRRLEYNSHAAPGRSWHRGHRTATTRGFVFSRRRNKNRCAAFIDARTPRFLRLTTQGRRRDGMARFGPRQLRVVEVVRRARRDLFNVLRRRRRQARVPRVQLGPRAPVARRLLHRVRDAGPVDVDVTNDVVAERRLNGELLRGHGVRQGLIILRRPGPSRLDVAAVCGPLERAGPLMPRQGAPLHFSSSASCPVVVRRPVRRAARAHRWRRSLAVRCPGASC